MNPEAARQRAGAMRQDFIVNTLGCRYGALIEFGLVRLFSSLSLPPLSILRPGYASLF
jgi:hypothetical protein